MVRCAVLFILLCAPPVTMAQRRGSGESGMDVWIALALKYDEDGEGRISSQSKIRFLRQNATRGACAASMTCASPFRQSLMKSMIESTRRTQLIPIGCTSLVEMVAPLMRGSEARAASIRTAGNQRSKKNSPDRRSDLLVAPLNWINRLSESNQRRL